MLQTKEGNALNDPETTYYDELKDRLELVLTLAEQGAQPPLTNLALR